MTACTRRHTYTVAGIVSGRDAILYQGGDLAEAIEALLSIDLDSDDEATTEAVHDAPAGTIAVDHCIRESQRVEILAMAEDRQRDEDRQADLRDREGEMAGAYDLPYRTGEDEVEYADESDYSYA